MCSTSHVAFALMRRRRLIYPKTIHRLAITRRTRFVRMDKRSFFLAALGTNPLPENGRSLSMWGRVGWFLLVRLDSGGSDMIGCMFKEEWRTLKNLGDNYSKVTTRLGVLAEKIWSATIVVPAKPCLRKGTGGRCASCIHESGFTLID